MERGVMTLTSLLFLTLMLYAATVQGQKDIRKPPKIEEPSAPKSLYGRKGDVIKLTCKADGHPPPFYVWKWNDAAIPSDKAITTNGRTGVLTINSLSISTEGFFKCEATVTFGQQKAMAKSPEIEVRMSRIELFKIRDDIAPIIKDEGQYAMLKCDELPTYYSYTTFAWQTIVGNQQKEIKMDDRMFVDIKGSLHFTYVLDSDNLKANDFYACGLSSEAARNKIVGSNRKLRVNAVDPIPAISPSIRFYTGMGQDGGKDLTFEKGSTGRLECVFSGYILENAPSYLPTIEWFEGQTQLTAGMDKGRYDILHNGHVLTIEKLKESDEKSYRCQAKENNAQALMTLNVTSVPIFVKTMAHQTVTQGSDVVFNCLTRPASGERTPEPPKWERNGRRLDKVYDMGKFAFQDGQTKLIVKDVSKENDIACFQCYVSNSVGTSTASACLNVVLPTEILTKPKEVQEVEEGDLVDLTVTARSDPLLNLTYVWVFKGRTYGAGKAPPYVNYDVKTKMAYINTTGFSDDQMRNISGLYSRLVYHSVETINITTDVVLEGRPVVVPVAAAGFDYWIIVIILIILIFIILIIIICCVICRRKMLEGDYPVDKKETAAGLDPEKELKDSGFHDLSRADYDYYPEKKGPAMDFDDIPIGEGDDESFGSAEYGEDAMAFTENGSFIGAYSRDKKGGSAPPAYEKATESNV